MNIKVTFALILASWFGSGYLRPASGTWGSLATIPFLYILAQIGGIIALFIAITLLFFPAVWAAKITDDYYHSHDNSRIVIDETLGMLATAIIWLFYVTDIKNFANGFDFSIFDLLMIFFTFRLCDIVKPPPANYIDKNMHNAYGVIIDDIFAGIYAGVFMIAIHHIYGFLLRNGVL